MSNCVVHVWLMFGRPRTIIPQFYSHFKLLTICRTAPTIRRQVASFPLGVHTLWFPNIRTLGSCSAKLALSICHWCCLCSMMSSNEVSGVGLVPPPSTSDFTALLTNRCQSLPPSSMLKPIGQLRSPVCRFSVAGLFSLIRNNFFVPVCSRRSASASTSWRIL